MMGIFDEFKIDPAGLPQVTAPMQSSAIPPPTDPMARIKEGPWWKKAAYLAAMTLDPEYNKGMSSAQDQYRSDLDQVGRLQNDREYKQLQEQQDRAYKEQQAQKEWEQGAPDREMNTLYKQTMIDQMQGKYRPIPGAGGSGRGGGSGGGAGRQYGKLRNLNSWESENNMPDLNLAMSAPMNDLTDIGSKRQALQNLSWKFKGTVYQPQIDDALDQLDQAEQSIRGQQERAMGPGGLPEQITGGLLQDANTPQPPQTRLQAIPGAIGQGMDWIKETGIPTAAKYAAYAPFPGISGPANEYQGAAAMGQLARKGWDWLNQPYQGK